MPDAILLAAARMCLEHESSCQCYARCVMELTPRQVRVLNELQAREFQIVAFPIYANHIGVRKGNCAALLAPIACDGFSVFGAPAYLVEGNFTVRVTQGAREWYVWKQRRVEVTPERLAEVEAFSEELAEALLPTA